MLTCSLSLLPALYGYPRQTAPWQTACSQVGSHLNRSELAPNTMYRRISTSRCCPGWSAVRFSFPQSIFKIPQLSSNSMFHFADGSCFPQAAIWNGQQSQGRPRDACLLDKLSEDCPAQPPYTGDNTHAHDFPTYYVVRKCDDNTWRVAYDLYFVKANIEQFDIAFHISNDT